MINPAQQEFLRGIPAVEQILQRPPVARWVESTSRPFVVAEIQLLLGERRSHILRGESPAPDLSLETLEAELSQRLARLLRPTLQPVVNATGVILHTNLGRAPQSKAAQEALSAISGSYANLEFNLQTGARWQRDKLVEPVLCGLLRCEAATVVNNCAAAVFLILNTVARGREVIVSRGELIEIGGSFRIPDIMQQSGAILREVGTTNKTRLADYESAITDQTALILRVHPSNYRICGFTEKPELGELVGLARSQEIPIYEDVGSGCLADLSRFGVTGEPHPAESLQAGVDVVSFSCDKLMGGPQAGVVAGSSAIVNAVRRNPLMRAFRVEKLIYAALGATLTSYGTGRASDEIPVLRLISMSSDDVRSRARRLVRRLKPLLAAGVKLELKDGLSVIGGGSCPDTTLATTLIAIEPGAMSAASVEERLRLQDAPVVVRVEEDRVLIDLRTVFPEQEATLVEGLAAALVASGQ